MQIRVNSRLFALTIIAVALSLRAVSAGEVGYPKASPSFTFNVPEKWTCAEGKTGTMGCFAPEGFRLVIKPSKATSKAEFKTAVADALNGQVTDAGAKDFKAGAIEEKGDKIIGHGECKFVSSDAKEAPTPYALTAIVFEAGGKIFQLTNTAPPATLAQHEAELKAIVDSIKPAGGTSADTKANEDKTEKKKADKKDDDDDADDDSSSGLSKTTNPSPSPSS
jgi:hypothetical protein